MGLVFPRRRTYTDLTPQDPDEKLLRSVENARLRLASVGVQEPQRRPSFLTSALDLLSRPNYAVAGLARELISPGERFEPGRELLRGLKGERRYTFKDVAKAAGISDKPLFRARFRVPLVGWNVEIAPSPAGIAGLAGDIALDPTNYITFGGLGAAKQLRRFGKLRPLATAAEEAGTVAEAIAAKRPEVAAQLQHLVDLRAAGKAARAQRQALLEEAARAAQAARKTGTTAAIPEALLKERLTLAKTRFARKAASEAGGLKFMGQTVIPGKAIKAGLELTGVAPAARWAGRLPAVATMREHVARIFDPAYHFRKAAESIQAARQLGHLEGRALTHDDVERMVRGMIEDFGRRGALAGFEKEEADRFIKAAFAPLGSAERDELRNLFEGAWRGKVPDDVAARVDRLRDELTDYVSGSMESSRPPEPAALSPAPPPTSQSTLPLAEAARPDETVDSQRWTPPPLPPPPPPTEAVAYADVKVGDRVKAYNRYDVIVLDASQPDCLVVRPAGKSPAYGSEALGREDITGLVPGDPSDALEAAVLSSVRRRTADTWPDPETFWKAVAQDVGLPADHPLIRDYARSVNVHKVRGGVRIETMAQEWLAGTGRIPPVTSEIPESALNPLPAPIAPIADTAGNEVEGAALSTPVDSTPHDRAIRDFDYSLYRRSPEYRELFWEYRRALVEAMGHAAGSDGLKTAVKNVADLQDSILGGELEEGLLTSAVADYFPHVRDPHVGLTAEQREVVAAKYGRDLLQAVTTGSPEEQMAAVARLLNPHARERTLQGTIREINQLVGRELFVEDPALALTVRAHRSIEARHAKAFLASVCQRWGKPLTYDTLKEAKQVIPRAFGAYSVQFTPEGVVMKEITQAELEGLRLAEKARAALGARVGRAVRDAAGALVRGEAAAPIAFVLPREFGDSMQRMARAFWTDDGARSLFGFLRGVNAAWRIHATVLRPGYQVRNVVGNLWNNFLAGVTNFADYAQAGRIQAAALARQSFEVATPLGRMPVEQVLDMMRERRVIQSYARMELGGGRGASVATLREQLRGGTWKPWSTEFKGARLGRAVAGTLEENARIAHFLNRWRVLGDPDAAAASVKKYLFDYFELTPVERNVLREVIPFYTYTRKNVPLQLERLLRTPGRFAMLPKLRRAIEGEAPDRGELPEYFETQGYIGLPARTAGGGRLYGSVSLPAVDVNKLRTDRPGVGFLQELMGMVSPALRVPIEQAMNQVLFSGSRIEAFRGETVPAPPAIRALTGWASQVPGVRNLLGALGVRQGAQGLEISARALHVLNSVPTVRDLLNLTDPENQRRALQAFSFLAGTTLAEEQQARRTGLYQRRDMLTDLLRQTEAQGVEVPTVADLGQQPQRRRGGLIFGGR